jgi:hypothetical protein
MVGENVIPTWQTKSIVPMVGRNTIFAWQTKKTHCLQVAKMQY